MTLIDVNDITRVIIVLLAVAVIVKTLVLFRRSNEKRFLAAFFPIGWSGQIVLFFILQRSGQVDPLLLNWFSQLIRLQALIYFLAV